jgi:hypothetical protein
MVKVKEDLTNKQFERLTVVKQVEQVSSSQLSTNTSFSLSLAKAKLLLFDVNVDTYFHLELDAYFVAVITS